MTSAAVTFARVDRWDAGYHLHRPHGWHADQTVRFGAIALRRVEPVPESERDRALRGSVHFDGTISLRSGRGPVGQLFYARPNDLVFSKIDARNGAIGLIAEDMPKLAFSPEFPVYQLDGLRVCPRFMKVLCRLRSFRDQINALVVGHSGRKRLAPALLEDVNIPLPDLDEQRKIADEHRELVAGAAAAAARSGEVVEEAYRNVLLSLGIESREADVASASVAVPFSRTDAWSVRKARDIAIGATFGADGTYPARRLGDDGLAKIAYGLTKSPENRPAANARPYLRVANVQAGELDLSEIKHIDVPESLMPRYRLEPDDLLLCEGNSEALVGRPALWRGEVEDCVHQNHLIRVRLDRNRLLPSFLLHYMNTSAARRYFASRAKRTTNLASINSTDVAELPCPVPPLDVQRDIVTECEQALREARTLREMSSQKLREADELAEARLLASSTGRPG